MGTCCERPKFRLNIFPSTQESGGSHMSLLARKILLLTAVTFVGCAKSRDLQTSPDTTQNPNQGEPKQEEKVLDPNRFIAQNMEVQSMLDLGHHGIQARNGNDIWGWTDPQTGREYAIMGFSDKTGIVDLTDPKNPEHLGDIPTFDQSSLWQDIKVYKDHAYIVSEAPDSGLSVFDLRNLRGLHPSKPLVFERTSHYDYMGNAHNIFINEDTGFAYAVGTLSCGAGVHVVNIQDPERPQFTTCIGRDIFEPWRPTTTGMTGMAAFLTMPAFDLHALVKDIGGGKGTTTHDDAYTHDIQCIVYNGPDTKYTGHEICFASNDNTMNIIDVTDKGKVRQIGMLTYNGVGFIHQGWLTEDRNYFLIDDEIDELNAVAAGEKDIATKTYIADVRDLENPKLSGIYRGKTPAIDHNLYIKGNLVFESNYTSGLRVLDASDVANGNLKEVGFFDGLPETDATEFDGTWSNYPFFKSGNIVVSYIDGRLFVVRTKLQ